MSNTPLYDTLQSRGERNTLRFHMPGHKGKDVFDSPLSGAMHIDFTELYGTGNLYDGLPPICDSERIAAQLWHVPDAFFITGGTTHGILAAFLLISRRTKHVLIDRGCHRCVYNATALFGLTPEYIFNEELLPFGVSAETSADAIDTALSANPDIGAVIITSPTYYGVQSDIAAIAAVCKAHGAILLVDEAHGAHLPFHNGFSCAVALGSSLGVCSMHKTLPALGQAALLTSDGTFSPDELRAATSMFGTSSPSYCIMASMELTMNYMREHGRQRGDALSDCVSAIRQTVNSRGVFSALSPHNGDPLRLCICTAVGGIEGYDAARILEEHYNIVCEMADMRNVLFIITVADEPLELQALSDALSDLEQYAKAPIRSLSAPRGAKAFMSPHNALLSRFELRKLCECEGAVSATVICPYPPGIPVVCGGEIISREHISFLLENGFSPDDPVSVII